MTISDRSTIVSDSTSTPRRVRTSAASLGVTPPRATKSPSHSYEMRTFSPPPAARHLPPRWGGQMQPSDLLQESQVGLIEQADVVDVVLQHRHPLDAETPRVAVPLR